MRDNKDMRGKWLQIDTLKQVHEARGYLQQNIFQ